LLEGVAAAAEEAGEGPCCGEAHGRSPLQGRSKQGSSPVAARPAWEAPATVAVPAGEASAAAEGPGSNGGEATGGDCRRRRRPAFLLLFHRKRRRQSSFMMLSITCGPSNNSLASLEECGRYLGTIKVYENKSADSIREQMDADYLSRLTRALTATRLMWLLWAGSLSRIMDVSMEELARCPGIGERKVKRLYDTFHEPFRRISSQSTIPSEASVGEKLPGESSSVVEGAEIVEEKADSSEAGKEPGMTVKSALSAAFAKYSDKIRKQERRNRSVAPGEETSGASSEQQEDGG
ncbi:hypothetical protein Taro_030949, partial [Colocasia esculenta]|nr:hypothetical protein [Colocasia esculenta]